MAGLPRPPSWTSGLLADEQAAEWRQVLIGLVLVAFAELLLAAVDLVHFGAGFLVNLRLGHSGLALLLASWLLLRRRTPSPTLTIGAALAAVLPFFYVLWVSEVLTALTLERAYSPFYGHRLLIIAVALLMPGPLWISAVLIVAFGLHAMALWTDLGLVDRPMLVAAGEPWFTVLYMVFGMGLLLYRAHHRVMAREYARARAEAEALERLARLFLAVRDGANTPLQTLESNAELLGRRHSESRSSVERMKRSVARLRELMESLASYEAWLRWQRGEESFDPSQVLRGGRDESRPQA